ncbi:hypothetical protein ACFLY7_01180 [Patescibacteria group bacterium]
MLNTFPILLSFGLIAPFILRIFVSFIFIKNGFTEIKQAGFNKKINFIIPSLEIISGLMLFVGVFTQVTVIALATLTLAKIIFKKEKFSEYEILTLLVLVSLIFSGAGFFAFDLPL